MAPSPPASGDPSSPDDATAGPGSNAAPAAAGPAPGIPRQIGAYRVLRVLGQGGMGTVFEAEQERPRRTVALKVVRAGSATRAALRRFDTEAQVLGLLQHPGIAQIYEAGTADLGAGPQPFFAMELVRGSTLLEYADAQKLGTRQRLALMGQICDAVQHAHTKGIIHRDLKPSNILVDPTGQPKILDFGVARTTDSDLQATLQTDIGQLVGTLAYMSPEQVAADPNQLDTRSDVYALGVVLFELLAGRLPYDIDRKLIHEAARIIREEDPTPLSALNRIFRGDVETIAGKALSKERERRYQTAAELAADIRHYLNHEPIAARRPSSSYQLRKFARRNRALVTGVAAAFLALLAGGVAATWQAVRATRAERQATASAERATREADKARAVNDFLQEMLAAADPANALGRELTVRQMIDEAAQKVDAGGLDVQPEVAATAHQTLGNTYFALGEIQNAAAHMHRAVALREQVLGPHHVETAGARSGWANTLIELGHYARADSQLTMALHDLRADGTDPEAVSVALGLKGTVAYNLGDFPGAEALHRESMQLLRSLPDDHRRSVMSEARTLSFTLQQSGKLPEAEPLALEALALARELYGPVHPEVIHGLLYVADLREAQAQVPAMREALEEADAIAHKLYPGDHPQRADIAVRRGMAALWLNDLDAAEGPLREGLEMRKRLLGPVHKDVALALTAVGQVELYRGKLDDAERLFREAMDIRTQVFGSPSPAVADSRVSLAAVLEAKQDVVGAQTLYRQALAEWRSLPGHERGGLVPCMNRLAILVQNSGDLREAEALFTEALTTCERLFGEGDPLTAQAIDNLGVCLFKKGDKSRAVELIQRALALRRASLPPGSPGLLVGIANLGYVLESDGRFAEAEPLYREYIQSALIELPADHTTVEDGTNLLAHNLNKQQKWAEAETLMRDRMAVCDKTHPKDCPGCATLRLRLGTAVAGLGRLSDALELLTDAWTRMDANPQTRPTRKRDTAEQLLAVYEALGRTDEAATWRDRLAALQRLVAGS